jgi:hypothetical protein
MRRGKHHQLTGIAGGHSQTGTVIQEDLESTCSDTPQHPVGDQRCRGLFRRAVATEKQQGLHLRDQ